MMNNGRFAFDACKDDSIHIFIMDEDGRNLRQLTWEGGNSSPSLSRDGTRIVFTSNRTRSGEERKESGIFVMNSDGTGETRLTQHSPEYGFGSPRFSPDGKRIVFAEYYEDLQCAIIVMSVDGSEARRVVGVPQWTGAVFTMDGENLLYDGGGQLYSVAVDGSEAKPLFAKKAEHYFSRPEVHPDGEKIVFLERFRQPSDDFFYPPPRSQYRLVGARLEGWDFIALTRQFKWPLGHALSPDGSRLAFLGCNLERRNQKGARSKNKGNDAGRNLATRLYIINLEEWEWESVPEIRNGALDMMSISWGPKVG